MKVRPMIFNTEMVKALLDGRKTVTRRPMKKQPENSGQGFDWWPSDHHQSMMRVSDIDSVECEHKRQFLKYCISEASPFGGVGDLIYVRETFRLFNNLDECGCLEHCSCPPTGTPIYLATSGSDSEIKWTSSIHMPRNLSRLTLKVTDVRIERLQDITEEQATKEGMPTDEECQRMAIEFGLGRHQKPVIWFKNLWDSIYGNWQQNPYVWVIEFEVIHQNVDKYLKSIGEAA